MLKFPRHSATWPTHTLSLGASRWRGPWPARQHVGKVLWGTSWQGQRIQWEEERALSPDYLLLSQSLGTLIPILTQSLGSLEREMWLFCFSNKREQNRTKQKRLFPFSPRSEGRARTAFSFSLPVGVRLAYLLLRRPSTTCQ